jgi:hypothetical protein
MIRQKEYAGKKFTADVIRDALGQLGEFSSGDEHLGHARIETEDGYWNYDALDEFFADYSREEVGCFLVKHHGENMLSVSLRPISGTTVEVEAGSRSNVRSVISVFDRGVQSSDFSEYGVDSEKSVDPPTVFIGHGRDDQWRELKDHLTDMHGYPVEAYETGSRAGHAIRDVLEDMLDASSFALLVMTAEDETVDGGLRARQNVVHEAGLFQGKLGFSRAIMLLEEGAEEFSNIQGIQQIRFSDGNIREVFGDVLAALKREFDT